MNSYNPFEDYATQGPDNYSIMVQGMMDHTHSYDTDDDHNFKMKNKHLDVGDIAVFVPPKLNTFFFYSVIGLFTFMVLSCLILNLFFASVLIKGVQTKKKPFYRLVWQIVLANIMSSVSNLITTFPPTFILDKMQSEEYLKTVFYQVVNFFDNMGDQLVMFMCVIIAVHRLFIFVYPNKCDSLFAGRNLTIILGITWLLCFTINILQLIYQCSYRYITVYMRTGYFVFNCAAIESEQAEFYIEKVIMAQIIVFPVIGVLCYLVIFWVVLRQRDRTSSIINKTERLILVQAAVLFAAFQIASVTSYTSLFLSTQDVEAYLTKRIVNTVELFAGTITPLLFFITSKELREGVGCLKTALYCNLGRSCPRKIRPVQDISPESFSTKTATLY